MTLRSPVPTKTRDPSEWPVEADRVDYIEHISGKKMPRCRAALARSKWDGPDIPRRCSQPRKAGGYMVCRYHGANGGGPLKHGERSYRHLGPLTEAYDRAKEGGLLLDDQPGLRVMHAWAEHLFELAGEGDGPEFRAVAVEMLESVEAAIGAGDQAVFTETFRAMAAHLRKGASKLRTRERAVQAVEREQGHKTAAVSNRLRAQAVVNADDVIVVFGRFIAVLRGILGLYKCEECGHLDRKLFDRTVKEVKAKCVDPAGRIRLTDAED